MIKNSRYILLFIVLSLLGCGPGEPGYDGVVEGFDATTISKLSAWLNSLGIKHKVDQKANLFYYRRDSETVSALHELIEQKGEIFFDGYLFGDQTYRQYFLEELQKLNVSYFYEQRRSGEWIVWNENQNQLAGIAMQNAWQRRKDDFTPENYALNQSGQPVNVSSAETNKLSEGVVAKITNYGIITIDTEPMQVEKDSNSPSGERRRYRYKDMKFTETTDKIPAKQGVRFGLTFEIRNLSTDDDVNLMFNITHPSMKTPDGKIITEQTYTRKKQVRNGMTKSANAYLLKFDYEVLPGEWVFEYLYQGKTLFKKKFMLVDSDIPKYRRTD